MSQFMVSFTGKMPPPWVLEGLRRGEIAALCLFAYNVDAPLQLRELTGRLRRAAQDGHQPPPLIGIDQEGGQLMAVTGGATELPGNMALGATRSPDLAHAAGRVLGLELLAMGCNLNFAPVLDLSAHPDNPAVGVRAFGDEPALVAELGAAFIRGLQSTGVLATAKHFPGQGDTDTDSHHAVPLVKSGLEALEAAELRPFRAAVAAGVAAVMSGHVRYSALDSAPATLSKTILEGLLRERLGFEGLVITDAMDMGAMAAWSPQERNAAALRAGADLLLLGHLPEQPALMAGLRELQNPRALARIRAARTRLPDTLPDTAVIGCTEHRQLARRIAEASITLVRGGARLPLRLRPEAGVVVITAQAGDLTPADSSSAVTVRLAEAVAARHPNTRALTLPHRASPEALKGVLQAARDAELVILGSIDARFDPAQRELARQLHDRGQSPVVVALRTPHDIGAFPFVDTYLCAYSVREASTEAAARVLFGELEPRGVLPCDLAGQGRRGVAV